MAATTVYYCFRQIQRDKEKIYRETKIQINSQTERQRETERQIDRKTERQIDRKTESNPQIINSNSKTSFALVFDQKSKTAFTVKDVQK